MDVGLTYQGQITVNPDQRWLADRQGTHMLALHLFAEACWMWEALRSQRAARGVLVNWYGPITKGDLFDAAIARRRRALLTGFFTLTDDELNDLAALPDLTTNQQRIRDRFLTLSMCETITTDRYGQLLPEALVEILSQIEETEPFSQQGMSAVTKRISLNGVSYFAKLTDEALSGVPPGGQDTFHEVTVAVALHALRPGLGPSEAYALLAADGSSCAVSREVAGKTYAASQRRWAKAATESQSVQWAVLAEWVFGLQDRSDMNLIINKSVRQVGLIDFAFAWIFRPQFLDEPIASLRPYACYTRMLFELHEPTETFARTVIQAACHQEAAVIQALAPFPMGERLLGLQRQFAILRAALTQFPADIRLIDIEHIAESWYNS
jgi:hypothetical protein